MRDFLFRPAFGLAEMLITTMACALMLSGHWLASIPVMLLSVPVAIYGRRYMLHRPIIRTTRQPARRAKG